MSGTGETSNAAMEWVCWEHAAEQSRDWETMEHMHDELKRDPALRDAVIALERSLRGTTLECPEHLGGVASYYFSDAELGDGGDERHG